MKKIKFSILTLRLIISSGLALNAQTSCDTTPDVGQTVGGCFTFSGPGGNVAGCNAYNAGPICYYTISVE
ncbi:hypothetical protein LZF95_05150 [Algoriphagus sp. AGSA1]|uniref:hypothetical protein n=1 Tax=Algoriphagus sp. AGSA1 TaxID=2907213 RepID=UPI001F4219E7|nr:hypothetical protein [Algoriphagus sp. AGSA1]MCE7054053.1 hypothetical protein [Algoriphagus sp. AGSA1]